MWLWLTNKNEEFKKKDMKISSTNRLNSSYPAKKRNWKDYRNYLLLAFTFRSFLNILHICRFEIPLRLIYSWIQSQCFNMFVNSVVHFFFSSFTKKVPVDLNSISFFPLHICLLRLFPVLIGEIQIFIVKWKSHSILGQKWIKIAALNRSRIYERKMSCFKRAGCK